MKFIQSGVIGVLLCMWCIPLFSQAPDLQLTLRYNLTLARYEVYTLPSATQMTFNWGPSQISIVTPASVPDEALSVISNAGGAWQDNSRVYAPAASPSYDFHGVGSLGAITTLFQGVEKLVFHFTIPGGGCIPGLRLFINDVDPNSGAAGMNGGDFSNTVFAIVPGVPEGYEAYTGNYDNNGTVCVPLPLELVSFMAIGKMSSIELSWQTTNEFYFKYFELERSTDELQFTSIAQVTAKGNTGNNHYTHTDFSVRPGIRYYYRLKMVDDDGFFIYSKLEETEIQQRGYAFMSVMPNPASGKVSVVYHAPFEEIVTVRLNDISGRLLDVQSSMTVTGDNTYLIDLSEYLPGVYWLSLISATNQVTTKLIRAAY